MSRPVPSREGLTSPAEIARALGVTVQAASNWMARHPDFPQPVEDRGGSALVVEEVARWLDGRRIHGTALRDDEEPGDTYGRRYRRVLGLPPSTAALTQTRTAGRSRRRTAAGEAAGKPWSEVMAELAGRTRGTVQDAATALLWLRAVAPDEWRASMAEGHRHVAARLGRRWPPAAPRLPDLLQDRWARDHFPKVALALDRTPVASRPGAFAALLDTLAEDRHDHLGWILTPPGLVRTMVRLADPQPGETVLDPCCGYGELLVGAGLHPARDGVRRDGDRCGADLRAVVHDERAWRLTVMNAQAHHLTVGAEVGAEQLVQSFPDGSAGPRAGADVVLTNPPFTRAGWTDDDPARQGPWPYGPPPENEAAFAWLQIAFTALTGSGRAVMVMPPRATHPRHARARRILQGMVEDGVVRCVVDLPGRLFRETSTPVSIWVLGAPRPDADRGVLLIRARDAVSGAGSTYRSLEAAGQDRILKAWKAWSAGQDVEEPGFSTALGLHRLREQSYDLSPSRYLRPAPASPGRSAPPGREPLGLAELYLELARLQERARHLDEEVGHHVIHLLREERP